MQRIPEAHECTLPNCGAQCHRQQQKALSPPPSAPPTEQNCAIVNGEAVVLSGEALLTGETSQAVNARN